MRRVADLALFGGPPAFAQPLHVGQLNPPAMDAVEAVFRGIFERRWYANHGPLVREFEQAFAGFLGVRHAVAVTNGTVALMVLARALEVTGEVIVPAFTFPATAQALVWAGLTPVFCDVDPVSHNLSAEQVRRRLTPRTAAILGVHLWGRACDPEGLAALASEHGLRLAFDACHAIACTHGGKRIGGLGDAEVFSFHATKIINGAEGGCITTNDDALAARLRTIRSFHPGEEYADVPLRINGKMSEAQAALALIGLADVPRHAAANRARHEAYRTALAGLPGLRLLEYPAGEDNNCQYLVVDVAADACGLTRDELFELLKAENVICRRYFHPGAHRMPPFRDDPAHRNLSLPVTDELCRRLLILPSGAAVSEEDIARIGALLRELIGLAPELRRTWEAAS